MSLRVWLPLNGNTNNYGCDGISFTGSPASYNGGKLGPASTFNGSVGNVIYNNTTAYNYTDNFSFCIWVYPIYTGSTAQYAFTVGRADAGGYGYGLQVGSSSEVTVRFGNKGINVNCPSNEWHHIAMSVSGSNIYVYKDGSLYNTSTIGSLPTYSDGNGVGLGCFHYSGNIYPYYGRINDFRIYDHCLSPREVKEISKGLMLHYPLDGNGKSSDNLVTNTNTANTNIFGYSEQTGGSTKTVEYDGGIPCIKVTRNTTAHSGWAYMWHSYLKSTSLKTNTTYTVSFDAIGSGSGSIGFSGFMNGNATNNLSASTTAIQSNFNSDKWSHIVFQTTTKSSFADLSVGGQQVYMSCGFMNSTGVWIMIKNMKVSEGSNDTPWIPAPEDEAYTTMGFNLTTEIDISGYKYNGARSGTFVQDANTPKYSACTNFANSPYIATPNIDFSGFTNSYTFSWWGKYTNYSSHMMWGFIDGNRLNPYMSGGNFYWNTGDGNNNPFNVSAATYGDGNWHHFAITGNGSSSILYIDGVKRGTAKNYKGITGTQIILNGWDTTTSYDFNGFLSDFRLYSTVLSEADILELYNQSAHIANNGSLLCYEIKEE